jgi:hypothetical protein
MHGKTKFLFSVSFNDSFSIVLCSSRFCDSILRMESSRPAMASGCLSKLVLLGVLLVPGLVRSHNGFDGQVLVLDIGWDECHMVLYNAASAGVRHNGGGVAPVAQHGGLAFALVIEKAMFLAAFFADGIHRILLGLAA